MLRDFQQKRVNAWTDPPNNSGSAAVLVNQPRFLQSSETAVDGTRANGEGARVTTSHPGTVPTLPMIYSPLEKYTHKTGHANIEASKLKAMLLLVFLSRWFFFSRCCCSRFLSFHSRIFWLGFQLRFRCSTRFPWLSMLNATFDRVL